MAAPNALLAADCEGSCFTNQWGSIRLRQIGPTPHPGVAFFVPAPAEGAAGALFARPGTTGLGVGLRPRAASPFENRQRSPAASKLNQKQGRP